MAILLGSYFPGVFFFISDVGKHPLHQLISDGINDQHFILPFGYFALEIDLHLWTVAYSAYRTHVERAFKLLVCHRMHLCFPPDTGSRAVFKRSYAAETSQLFGIVEAGKTIYIDQEPSGCHKTDRAYRGDILKGGG